MYEVAGTLARMGKAEDDAALCFKSRREGITPKRWTDAEKFVVWINVSYVRVYL
jgi:hypothetical protein